MTITNTRQEKGNSKTGETGGTPSKSGGERGYPAIQEEQRNRKVADTDKGAWSISHATYINGSAKLKLWTFDRGPQVTEVFGLLAI